MGLCLSMARNRQQGEAAIVEECIPELASGRIDSFSIDMSRSFSFMRDAPRFSNAYELGDCSIVAKSHTTGTTTIQDIRMALENLSNSNIMGKAVDRKHGEQQSKHKDILYAPLLLHLSNVLAAKRIAAIETGKGDRELGIPPKLLRSRSFNELGTFTSSFRSISFSGSRDRSTKSPTGGDSWEELGNEWFKTLRG